VQREDYPEARLFVNSNASQTLAFASEAMPHGTLGRRISVESVEALRQLVSRWVTWPDVLVFDQWIANPDRHPGNLLVGAQGEIYLIDHGLSFLRRNWPPEHAHTSLGLVTARLWKDVLASFIPLPERIQATSRLYAAATRCSLIDVVSVLAAAKVSGLIPAANVDALLRFLSHRTQVSADVICNVIGVPSLDLRTAK
jgi:hypothetical protein